MTHLMTMNTNLTPNNSKATFVRMNRISGNKTNAWFACPAENAPDTAPGASPAADPTGVRAPFAAADPANPDARSADCAGIALGDSTTNLLPIRAPPIRQVQFYSVSQAICL